MWFGQVLSVLRISLGDFSWVGASPTLSQYEIYLFWFFVVLTVFSQSIVMLNFIVAEASNSYKKINHVLDQVIQKGKSDLISDADRATWQMFKDSQKLPKYLIVREVQN